MSENVTPLTVARRGLAPVPAAGVSARLPLPEHAALLHLYKVTLAGGAGQVTVVGDRFTVDKPGVLQIYRGPGPDPVAVFAIGGWFGIEVAIADVQHLLAEAFREWAQPDPEEDWDGAPAVAQFADDLAAVAVEEIV